MMKTLVIAAPLALLLAACGNDQTPPAASAATPAAAPALVDDALPEDGAFIGKVWIATTQGRALGEMVIFLPDRSLVMDSCFETYRISGWGVAGDNIRWLEDSIPIEATVKLLSPEELSLQIVGQEHAKTYVSASVPYVCPDMPK